MHSPASTLIQNEKQVAGNDSKVQLTMSLPRFTLPLLNATAETQAGGLGVLTGTLLVVVLRALANSPGL